MSTKHHPVYCVGNLMWAQLEFGKHLVCARVGESPK